MIKLVRMAGGVGLAAVRIVVHGVWGLPQTLVGGLLTLGLGFAGSPHRVWRSAIVTEWPLASGLSLGLFVFVPEGCPSRLLVHEYGHSVQSLILGPLYVPLVVVPSLVWAGVPALGRWRRRHGYSYYRFLPERLASDLGERVCGEPAAR